MSGERNQPARPQGREDPPPQIPPPIQPRFPLYQQVLTTNQNYILFEGPFDEPTYCNLTVTNPSDRRVAYMIKATHPHHYVVTPNLGILEPGQRVKIRLTFAPCVRLPRVGSHRIQIVSGYVGDDYSGDVQHLLHEFPENKMKSILYVYYDDLPDYVIPIVDTNDTEPLLGVDSDHDIFWNEQEDYDFTMIDNIQYPVDDFLAFLSMMFVLGLIVGIIALYKSL